MVARPRLRGAVVARTSTAVFLATAVILASGCLYVGGNAEKPSTTTLTVAQTTSVPPPLAAFVIRVAEDEDALEPAKARALEELGREVDEAVRPVEDARVVLVEVLARALTERRFLPASAEAASDRFVRAVEQAAPRLRAAVERLHVLLDAQERAALVQAVEARIDRWSRFWSATSTSPLAEHTWVKTLASERPATSEIEGDAVASARRWSERSVSEVAALAEDPAIDSHARRELVSHLRASGHLR